MNMHIRIKNAAQIKAAFDRAPGLMTRHLQVAIRRAIILIGGQSRRNTPVQTGRLRASTYERFYSSLKAEIGTNTNYDYFVHEGTKFMRARPYLRMAIESTETGVQDEFTNAVKNTLDDIGGMV